MRAFLSFVWREHRVVGLAVAACAVALAVLLADFAAEAVTFANPANRDRTIEPWMSVRYVEQSWGLTKPVMFDIIGLPVDTPPDEVPRDIGAFLATSDMTLPEFQAAVERAQADLRAGGSPDARGAPPRDGAPRP